MTKKRKNNDAGNDRNQRLRIEAFFEALDAAYRRARLAALAYGLPMSTAQGGENSPARSVLFKLAFSGAVKRWDELMIVDELAKHRLDPATHFAGETIDGQGIEWDTDGFSAVLWYKSRFQMMSASDSRE